MSSSPDKWSWSQCADRIGFLGLLGVGNKAEKVTEVDDTLVSLWAAGWPCLCDASLSY